LKVRGHCFHHIGLTANISRTCSRRCGSVKGRTPLEDDLQDYGSGLKSHTDPPGRMISEFLKRHQRIQGSKVLCKFVNSSLISSHGSVASRLV
jgi:hypothetical protein